MDGFSTAADSLQLQWSQGGTYSIYVRAVSYVGSYSSPESLEVKVDRAPVVRLDSVSKDTLHTSDSALITASISDSDGNQVDSLFWDLNGDGIFATAALASQPQYAHFPTASVGSKYWVKVWGKDYLGMADTARVLFYVLASRAPVVSAIRATPSNIVGIYELEADSYCNIGYRCSLVWTIQLSYATATKGDWLAINWCCGQG